MATGGGKDGVPDIPSNLDSKTLLKSDALYQYILDTTVLPHESDCLRELRILTGQHPWAIKASPPDELQLLGMLIKMIGAKNTIEVGVFTGCSLLATALALPDDGKIIAIDNDRDSYEVGRPIIEKAGVAHKVDFREGKGLEKLDELLAEEGNKGKFDFAFVDADKPNYKNYHEQLLQLVRVGGIIVYDNTLWGGLVALPPDAPLSDFHMGVAAASAPGTLTSDFHRRTSEAMKELNAMISADPRVEVCLLSIADGVAICRRLV